MQEILLKTPTTASKIRIGAGCVKETRALLSAQKNFLLIDKKVHLLYAQLFCEYFSEDEIFVLESGEENKNFATLEKILTQMASVGLNRKSKIFAVGGGVVGDIGGLASALYMRGISCVQIPTTLLAQIDSSVGGKTAVNLGETKNLIGAFYQPQEVLIDPEFLKTLPKRELKSGLGELVKYGGLNNEIFKALEHNLDEILSGNAGCLTSLITACVAHKAGVVARDERESGERKSLNLGHTTAHALELAFSLSHGESVLYGLALETRTAVRLGVCESGFANRFLAVVDKVLKSEPYQKIDDSKFLAVENWGKAVKMDKKNTQDRVVLTLLTGEGTCSCVEFNFEQYCFEMKKSVQEF